MGEAIERSGNTKENKKRIQETMRRTSEMERKIGIRIRMETEQGRWREVGREEVEMNQAAESAGPRRRSTEIAALMHA